MIPHFLPLVSPSRERRACSRELYMKAAWYQADHVRRLGQRLVLELVSTEMARRQNYVPARREY